MTPLPPQPPKKRKGSGALPKPGARQDEDAEQKPDSGQEEQPSRRSSALPVPEPKPAKSSSGSSLPPASPPARREPEEDEPDDGFETVSLQEQDRLDLDAEYEERAGSEQVDLSAEEYDDYFSEDGESVSSVDEDSAASDAPSRENAEESSGTGDRRRSSSRDRRSKSLGKSDKKGSKDKSKREKVKGINDPDGGENPRPNFVDEDNLKLKPYGRKKSSRAYISDVDKRANLRKKATFIQFGALGLLALAVGFGFKNAVFPPPTLSETDVAEIVSSQTGELGFPSARGEGFAKDFMSAWAQRDDSPIRAATLERFYGSEGTPEGETMEVSGDFRQDIVYGPTVYEKTPVSANSENYVIGVGVSVSDTQTGVPLQIGEGEANIQWRYFSVSVYWDEATDAMSIVPGSPSLVPPYENGAQSDVPTARKPGTGEENSDLTEATMSTVEGFMSGYVDASEENTAPIEQYINREVEDDPVFLERGMDNGLELDGEVSEAVEHTVYTVEPDNEEYVAAEVNVRWKDTSAGEESAVTYTSTYNMRLVQESEGRWAVTGFWPMYYVPEEDG